MRASKSPFWSLACAALVSANTLAAAQEFTGRPDSYAAGWAEPGFIWPQSLPQSEASQLFETAGRQPNFTNSVSFQFAPGNLSESESDTTWTWVLNTTEFALPEEAYQEGRRPIVPGARVMNQQWALQWPGGGNLQASIDRWDLQDNITTGLCFAAASWQVASNVSSRYPDAEPGNCTAILGAPCADALSTQILLAGNGNCRPLSSRFDECAGSIEYQGSRSPGNYGWANSSDTFYAQTSRADLTMDEREEAYESSLTSMHVLLVADISQNSPTVAGSGDRSQLLCQIIDPAESGGEPLPLNRYMIVVSIMAMVWGLVPL